LLKVTVIATVKNEAGSIQGLLDSLLAQTRCPDEIVFVDGGSTDGTVEVIRAYQDRLPVVVSVRPGCNISEGRNAAIGAARHDFVAATDAGVRLSSDWLECLLAPLEEAASRGEQADRMVACGFFAADPRSVFEVAMGATVLPRLGEIDPTSFLPSSRSVAFSKRAWNEVGGYPEWLDYCEDLVFDFSLRRAGYRFVFVPTALVHFRPRSSLRAFFKQYYRYARGDGKADLWLKRHLIRYGTYAAGGAILGLGIRRKGLWVLLAVAAAAYLHQPYRRLMAESSSLSLPEKVVAAGWIPVIRLAGDLAKMIGYPVGVVWRLRRVSH
jgi:glycosyltransferase involved in cell wall biosynthesis